MIDVEKTKDQIIKDYLNEQIEFHKNDQDFDDQYNEAWVDGTTTLAIKDGFNADVIVKWAEQNKTWPSMRNLAYVIWCLETYND
jgi:hypothetical protein